VEVVMTKSRITILAGALWVAGLASTAAFAYTMNRPLTAPPPTVAVAQAPLHLERVLPFAAPAQPEPRLIVLPTVEIVSHIARPVAAAPRAEPKPRDISAMKCSDFKPLAQGTGGVQLCE
jgi:hypothetical protein